MLLKILKIEKVEDHTPRAVGRVTIRPENGVKIVLKIRDFQ